jgi:hypothetical protein
MVCAALRPDTVDGQQSIEWGVRHGSWHSHPPPTTITLGVIFEGVIGENRWVSRERFLGLKKGCRGGEEDGFVALCVCTSRH